MAISTGVFRLCLHVLEHFQQRFFAGLHDIIPHIQSAHILCRVSTIKAAAAHNIHIHTYVATCEVLGLAILVAQQQTIYTKHLYIQTNKIAGH